VPFPRKLLNEGEDIVLDMRPHWWVFVKPIVLLILVVAATVVAANFIDNDLPVYVGLGMTVFVLLGLVWRYLLWVTTNFVVTTDRLIYRAGVFGKSGREIPLERLNDISVNQTLFERLIRAGDVMIESGGERGQQTFRDIKAPFIVQNVIYREIENAQARDAERISGHHELSVPEQIEKLAELRDRGVLSPEEFEAKKAQLLERM
jgi:uncharacterized membrane protein YdbT with pleckstrin-like domain